MCIYVFLLQIHQEGRVQIFSQCVRGLLEILECYKEMRIAILD